MVPLNNYQQKILNDVKGTFDSFLARSKITNIFKTYKNGVYLYGPTGCGKTTIMDSFFSSLASKNTEGINMHFHDYFNDISRILTTHNIPQISKIIKQHYAVLCFDEFFIESIADAKILSDILSKLVECGLFIVLTSNFKPEDLYKNGFNREIVFPQFSDFITKHFNVIDMSGKDDFRTATTQIRQKIVFSDIKEFQEYAKSLNCNNDISENSFSGKSKIVIFDYNILLKRYLSIKEIINIVRYHHIICIRNMISLTKNNEDEAIRFRDLIDMAYLRNINIILHCKTEFSALFDEELSAKQDFKRTLSRLSEMSHKSYIMSETKLYKRVLSDAARDFFEKAF